MIGGGGSKNCILGIYQKTFKRNPSNKYFSEDPEVDLFRAPKGFIIPVISKFFLCKEAVPTLQKQSSLNLARAIGKVVDFGKHDSERGGGD